MNAHEVKPVRLIQSLCAVCGSNLAGLSLLYYSAALRGGCRVPPCVADVSIVNCAVCQQFNKRTLLIYYYYYYYQNLRSRFGIERHAYTRAAWPHSVCMYVCMCVCNYSFKTIEPICIKLHQQLERFTLIAIGYFDLKYLRNTMNFVPESAVRCTGVSSPMATYYVTSSS